MNSTAGVYEIKNTVNGKRYIGSSINVTERLNAHKRILKRGAHCNSYLQRAFKKYGENNFLFKQIIVCDEENTLFYEQKCLDCLHPEYNIAKDAMAPMLGLSFTEEHKRKIGEANKISLVGKKLSIETRLKLSKALMGNTRTLGNRLSEEHKQKLSEALRGKNKWAKGRKHTKEEIQKQRLAQMGHVCSEETREKISVANLGKRRTAEEKMKMSAAQKGKRLSEEHKRKISEGVKRWLSVNS